MLHFRYDLKETKGIDLLQPIDTQNTTMIDLPVARTTDRFSQTLNGSVT